MKKISMKKFLYSLLVFMLFFWFFDFAFAESQEVVTEIFGYEIKMEEVGWILFGVILGLADWINPCVLWVLVFLLTYLVSIGSSKKLLIAGMIFAATTFVFYFTVMLILHYTIFSITPYMGYIGYVKTWIGIFWIILGLLAIKDFLGYKWGPSLAIPEKAKPTIQYIARKWTYASAFVLALFASFVELPCTIWIPLMYISAIWPDINVFSAIFLYNIFYIIPVALIILSVYIWYSKIKSGEKEIAITKESNRKWMKLLSWIILILIGLMFVFWVI